MSARSDHLIERAAAKLRAGAESPSGAPAPAPLHGGSGPLPEDGPGSNPHVAAIQREATPAHAGLPSVQEPAPEIDLGTLEQAGLVVGRMTRTRISEEFRIAVGRIARTPKETGPSIRSNILMVTSPKPGEGKTFTALNLAAALAQLGPRRVVLTDVDSKRHSLSDHLGLRPRRGVLDLSGDAAIDPRSLPVTTEVGGLSIVPTGQGPSDETQSGHVRLLGSAVERVAASFPDRLIVLDTAPCLSTSDPSTLAGHVGHIVMVVEAERTQRNELEAAIDFVRACPLITILLNKTRMSARHTFGAYDYLGSYQ